MREAMQLVLQDIARERATQDKLWGPSHDNNNTPSDWVAIAVRQLGLGLGATANQVDPKLYRHKLVCAAAVLVAAVEALDRQGKVAGRFNRGSGV